MEIEEDKITKDINHSPQAGAKKLVSHFAARNSWYNEMTQTKRNREGHVVSVLEVFTNDKLTVAVDTLGGYVTLQVGGQPVIAYTRTLCVNYKSFIDAVNEFDK